MRPPDLDPIPCSRWAAGPSVAPKACVKRASVFLVREGVPEAYCWPCRSSFLGPALREEVSREEYLRLLDVAEVMSS